ncbi:short-chain dehydrogenase [Aspergillus sclerotioniger CBS 115572]|uniref:Short-chain dehydrogenase n=1 Tax=Aspergillus sclerotioniger CBS 115572 TaxID=1450535 RepID=A0A317XDU7_9EURO|nr:short-chain dehydrogenase [Aspergillus sclerotioniger CBS 115572]PWY95922.1 short-chain dehydrogenase [Aspergillus sclerotioniger CBS 115572]
MSHSLTAIVTGAAGGIGQSIARRLVKKGYRIAINDIPIATPKLEEFAHELNTNTVENPGAKAITIPGDVTSKTEVATMISKTVSTLGPLHLMIANAGKAPVKPLLSVTDEDIADVFSCNFTGVFNCYTEAARQMIDQGDPNTVFGRQTYKIVGASSIAGIQAFAALGLYSASKFAVRGLTQTLAKELASHHITVNAYAPGIIGTSMWTELDKALGKLEGRAPGESLKQYSKGIALGRTGVPDDVGGLVGGFLASEDSDYLTGQTIVVDGGVVLT